METIFIGVASYFISLYNILSQLYDYSNKILSLLHGHCDLEPCGDSFIGLPLMSNLMFFLSFFLAYTVIQVGCLLTHLRVFHFFLHIRHKKLTGLSLLCLLLTLFLLQQQVTQQPNPLLLLLASFQICHYLFPQQTLQHRWASSVFYILYPWDCPVNKYLSNTFLWQPLSKAQKIKRLNRIFSSSNKLRSDQQIIK